MRFTSWYQEPIEVTVDIGPEELTEWIEEMFFKDPDPTTVQVMNTIDSFAGFFINVPDELFKTMSENYLRVSAAWLRRQATRLEKIANDQTERDTA